MSRSHPLASRESLDAREVARQPFVSVAESDPVTADFWTLQDFRDGEPITVGAWITGFEDMFAAIRAGQAVAVIPKAVAGGLPWDDIVVRDVELPPATVALCRREGEDRPVVDAFAQAVRSVVG